MGRYRHRDHRLVRALPSLVLLACWFVAPVPEGLAIDSKANLHATLDLTDPFHPACRDATVTRSGVYKIDAMTRKVTAVAHQGGRVALLLSGRCHP
jgi:hypothetical protein